MQMSESITENAKVRDIRRRLKDGESGAGLAREYGVTRGLIYHIAHNRAWTHKEAQL